MAESHVKPDDEQRPVVFFAQFLPGFNSETLKIPRGILKQRTNRAILNSSFKEGEWDIDIYQIGKDSVFCNGWQQFVEDHDLHENDFLVFEYDGVMRFRVRVFQQDCMEKEKEKEDLSDMYTGVDLSGDCDSSSTMGASSSISRIRRDKDIFERKASSFNSRNPYFWRVMKSYNVQTNYALSIPKSMTKDIIPEKTRKVRLKNRRGEAWKVKMVYNKGQVVFTSGWKRFVVENCVKVDDVCIFELVGETQFQVHVY